MHGLRYDTNAASAVSQVAQVTVLFFLLAVSSFAQGKSLPNFYELPDRGNPNTKFCAFTHGRGVEIKSSGSCLNAYEKSTPNESVVQFLAAISNRPLDGIVAKSPVATTITSTPPPASEIKRMTVQRPSVQKGMQAFEARDHETALAHWLPKAREGDLVAQNNMGVLFEGGHTSDTPRSDDEAANWYVLSAQQGFPLAMVNLARVQTRLGHDEAAISWLNLAAR